ncbi:MAG: AMP-binding protein [Candidatus Omnitrophota bacterium]
MNTLGELDFRRKGDIVRALGFRGEAQERLFELARKMRDDVFQKKAEVRSVIEYSNLCRQECQYCGMSRKVRLERYVMDEKIFLAKIGFLYDLGRRIIMVQTGEWHTKGYFNRLCNLLKQARDKYPSVVWVCSFGSLDREQYKKLRAIGIQRYLLKFETSDENLYRATKPSDTLKDRLSHIRSLKKMGFLVSSGNIVGLPGQSAESLANDLLLLKKLDLPMGSAAAFIPNNRSVYADRACGDIHTTLNFMAILRILCPTMVIPSTSSMESTFKDGQYLGLMAGANAVTIHDGTQKADEEKFLIYDANRYIPRNELFVTLRKTGLEPSQTSLIRTKIKDTLIYRLHLNKLGRKNIAVRSEGRVYSHQDLHELILRFCSVLERHRIREGQTVILALYDSVEFVVAFLSCLLRGVIAAPIDPLIGHDEFQAIFNNAQPSGVLATQSFCEKFPLMKTVKISDDDSSGFFLKLVKHAPRASLPSTSVESDTPAVILYTSGTTGTPKGVVHTHRQLLVTEFPKKILKMTGRDIIFSCSRIFTSFGLGNSLLFPFHTGASVILSRTIPNPFSLKKILKQKPTLFFAVPAMYHFILADKSFTRRSFPYVRIFVASGEKLYGDVFSRWKAAYGRKLLECFGSTEMCHPFISNVPRREKKDSPGKVLPGFQVKFDPDGRMVYTGPSLFYEYYRDSALTQEMKSNGWFRSDDIGYRDKHGYVFLQGRSNLVLKLNGRWVSIPQVEDKARRSQLVEEIVAFTEGDRLSFYVSFKNTMPLKKTQNAFQKYCAAHLAAHELPRNIYIVKQIPRTASGKIKRRLDRLSAHRIEGQAP